jgi:hypothetical protein
VSSWKNGEEITDSNKIPSSLVVSSPHDTEETMNVELWGVRSNPSRVYGGSFFFKKKRSLVRLPAWENFKNLAVLLTQRINSSCCAFEIFNAVKIGSRSESFIRHLNLQFRQGCSWPGRSSLVGFLFSNRTRLLVAL